MVDSPDPKFVFISYSRTDGDFVNRLISDLRHHNIQVWIDNLGLKPGTRNWEKALREAVRASKAVLLVASPSSRQSDYVQDELAVADMYGCPVYPIWASGEDGKWMECIPLGMGKMQYIDARDARYAIALPEIVATLKSAVSVPDVMPESHAFEPSFEPRNPYKGLRAFTDDDAGDFFGREKLVEALIQRLRDGKDEAARCLAIVGPSGSGKSSVIMAGLLPHLVRGDLPGSETWVYIDRVIPGVHPLEGLTIALSGAMDRSMASIREDLDASSRGLLMLIRLLARRPDQRVILFIDQFEELFAQATDEDERRQFISLLLAAIAEPNNPTLVILTLRADFYDRPMNYPDLGRLIEEHHETVLEAI